MSESADYDPGVWKGYSFASARKAYDVHAGRSYSDAVAKAVNRDDLVPEEITTESEAPVIIACDVTGSMEEWPATIFSKLPYLDLEGKEYMGESMEVAFAAIGDCFSDKYPLQVRKFAAGKEMEARLKELVVEKGGGGTSQESYDLAALYFARNVKMPKAIKPLLIFIGDEGLYDFVDRPAAEEWARCKVEERVSLESLFAELKRKFSVYLVRKSYRVTGNMGNENNDRIQRQWEKLLGEDHVSMLPEASRVVDVIFGIMAKETGREAYFKKELTERQKPEQVEMVMKSLNTIHKLPAPDSKKKSKGKKGRTKKSDDSGHSMTRRSGPEGKDSISLT